MKTSKFFKELADLLEIDEELYENTDLTQYEEFDSLAIMSLIAFIDQKFAIKIPGKAFAEITTIDSLMALIGKENFE